MPGECADWFLHNIMTWSYCFHRRYNMSRQKNRNLINEHALNSEPVPSSFTFLLNTHTLSTYLKNAGRFLPHASLLQVALTVVELTDWLFLRISKSIYSESIFAGFCCPWKKKKWILSFDTFKQHQTSLTKQATFRDAPTCFLVNWRLRNERRKSILMIRHYNQVWVVLLIGWSKFPTRHDRSETLPRSR